MSDVHLKYPDSVVGRLLGVGFGVRSWRLRSAVEGLEVEGFRSSRLGTPGSWLYEPGFLLWISEWISECNQRFFGE